ncbi:nucleoside deaminase [Bernardetia sp. ABR2-2B]|uniref:nucleoside deaminase n=1 Tax=Bernardetia sp. ABR2-2B TaxID=3127472 RepID=UPI0030D0BD97
MKEFMSEALEEAKKGKTLYGAVLVENKSNEIVARAFNTVKQDSDVSAHAELNLIRDFCKENKITNLENYTLVTTCEPCPMCATTAVWAKVSRIVFGLSIKDLIAKGESQIDISCKEIIEKSSVNIKVEEGVLRGEVNKWYAELKS